MTIIEAPKPDDIIHEQDPIFIVLWGHGFKKIIVTDIDDQMQFIHQNKAMDVTMSIKDFCRLRRDLKIIQAICLNGYKLNFVSSADGSLERLHKKFGIK